MFRIFNGWWSVSISDDATSVIGALLSIWSVVCGFVLPPETYFLRDRFDVELVQDSFIKRADIHPYLVTKATKSL